MKTFFLFLFAVQILISCDHNEDNQRTTKTVITGQVDNFDKISEHETIDIVIPDLLAGQKKISQQINEKGQFRFEIDIKEPTEFNLKYSGYLTYYIFPGDSINFRINSDCWSKTTNKYAEESKFYILTGISEKMNSDVSKFMAIYRGSLINWQANSDSA